VARPVSLPTGLRLEPARAASRPAAPARTRITRRGRLVLLVLSALILLAVISVGRAGSQAATATETGPALQQTTVQPGETLWAVAQRIAPDNDPRQVVAQIRRINHLPSSSLRAGQQLLLPVPTR
jgi:Tfp pilus assembly protein FimV